MVVVYGNPVDGFSFIGPFEDREMAINYAEKNCDGDWWLGALEPW